MYHAGVETKQWACDGLAVFMERVYLCHSTNSALLSSLVARGRDL